MTDKLREDRSFDNIADHFSKKVYGGLKGDIRLAVLKRDLFEQIKTMQASINRPLRILDIGAGLAQISIELAKQGHHVVINDISENMLSKAKQSVLDIQSDTIIQNMDVSFYTCPYQALEEYLTEPFDIILNHAVLEWLAEPELFIHFAQKWLCPSGTLSLCFYNPASFVYRNLIMGNFNLLNNPDYKADNVKSLTPNHPVDKKEVFNWLDSAQFDIASVSGMRVFHDYSPLKRGGHNFPESVLEMELKYSSQEPFKWLGRYLHVMAIKK